MDKAAGVMELMFPPRCLFCGEVKPFRLECPDCARLEKENRLTGESRYNYQLRARAADSIAATVSSYIYSDEVAALIARYKFRRHYTMAREMAKIMASDVYELFGADCCDAVVPVPAHKNGESRHSALLAKRVAKLLSKPLLSDALEKNRITKPQHRLTFAERAENLKGAFSVPFPDSVRGKRVLLCDDVMTSGNTLNGCAAALLDAGAREIITATFAVTRVSATSGTAAADKAEAKKEKKKAAKSKPPKRSKGKKTKP